VTLAGNVDAAFDLTPLFMAVRDLLEQRPADRRILRLNFIGTKRRERSDAFRVKEGLGDVIRFHPHVDHETCLQMIAESPVALLAAAERFVDNGVKLSAKLYEYLYLRKPVLSLITPGPATRLLARAGLGLHCLPDDVDGMRKTLADLVDRFGQDGIRLDPDEAFIARYDRRTQVARLAEILDDVTRRAWHAGPAIGEPRRAATSAVA
jgi:glycosyltransferase involved in cell wall biosynthesis